jgi:hypothetical protein
MYEKSPARKKRPGAHRPVGFGVYIAPALPESPMTAAATITDVRIPRLTIACPPQFELPLS